LRSNAFKIISKLGKEHHPEPMESLWGVNDRATFLKKFAKDYIEKHKIPE